MAEVPAVPPEEEVERLRQQVKELKNRLTRVQEQLKEADKALENWHAKAQKAEEGHCRTETVLSSLLNAVPQSIFWKDQNSVYLGCNQAFAQSLGLRCPELVVGKTDFDFPSPREEAEAYRADDAQVMATKEAKKHFVEPLQKTDGTRLWIDISKVPLLDSQGTVYGVLGIYEDITEHKRTEMELRWREQLFRETLENVRLIAVSLDRHGRLTFANRFFLELTGWEEGEVVGADWFTRFVPPELDLRQEFEKALAQGTIFAHHDNEILTRDGQRRQVRWNNTLVRDLEGKIVGTSSIGEDITERVRAQTALRTSEERLWLALEAAQMGTWEWDLSNGSFPWDDSKPSPNRPGGQSTGNPFATFYQQVHPEDQPRIKEAVKELLAGGNDYEWEFRVVLSGGEVRWLVSRGHALQDGSGRPTKIIGINFDITERKRVEEERKRFEQRMQETQRLESLGVLAGGIAHDFNNLLMCILGFTEMAQRELPAGLPPATYLEQVRRAGQRAAELCRQMLAYAGKGRYFIGPVDLNALVNDTTELLKVSLSKQATLSLRLAKSLPLIEADASQLRQVIMNLVINASEALGENPGVITLFTEQVQAGQEYLATARLGADVVPGEYVCLEVSDTGCGMEEETQARIFEPFFTTKFKGRGLGMAAVMGILRAHKGALWLESQPGQGTLLRLLFPTLSRPVSAPPRQIPGVAVSANGTVLVVDDEESVREVTGSMLKDLGFRVHLAPDSHQALEFLRTGPSVRLVLLDLTMPGLTGNKALCAIQQVRPHLPVILMSGFSEDELSQRYADCGFAGFLHKPFCQGELGIKLKSVLAD